MLEGVRQTGVHEWEVPVGYVPGMRVPGKIFPFGIIGEQP